MSIPNQLQSRGKIIGLVREYECTSVRVITVLYGEEDLEKDTVAVVAVASCQLPVQMYIHSQS